MQLLKPMSKSMLCQQVFWATTYISTYVNICHIFCTLRIVFALFFSYVDDPLEMEFFRLQSKQLKLGSGCGLVGRAVASDSKEVWFKYSHMQNFIKSIFTVDSWKDVINKEAGIGHYKIVKLGLPWLNEFVCSNGEVLVCLSLHYEKEENKQKGAGFVQ